MKVSNTQVLAGLFLFMAQIRLGVGQVNIVDHLIVIARKTTTPLVIEAQESYPPPQPATQNVVVPAVGDIDPAIYYVDFRESVDGISLGLLLSQFVYDLKNKVILAERRFYRVNGSGPNDPASEQNILTDPYLDGKTISGVFKEGFRYLLPHDHAEKEYDLHAGGGIELLNDKTFADLEVWMVEISYLADQSQVGTNGGGLYNGVVTLTADTALNNTHRGKRLKCESNASSRLVVTLEDLVTVPDAAFYHFTSNGGNQFQTRIIPFVGQTITYNGEVYTEMTIAKGEYLRIEKVGTIWEATMVHPGILQVGERIAATWKDHPNTKPEDNTLYDGDDWPRIWWWIKNKLPITHYAIDDNVINPGYVHPVGLNGLFIIHSTQKKFRVPDTQGWSEKGLSNFSVYGTDATRVYDYPGGVQGGQVGEFNMTVPNAPVIRKTGTSNSVIVLGVPSGPVGGANPDAIIGNQNITINGINAGKVNTVNNIGVVYLRRF